VASRTAGSENSHDDDLVPPPAGISEKNYYLDKAVRKTKKYDAVVDAIKASLKDTEWDQSVKVERDDDEYEDEDDDGNLTLVRAKFRYYIWF
jgi:hypothetical protein